MLSEDGTIEHVIDDADGATRFLDGGGPTGALIRAHDWSATPLGPPAAWPTELKTLVGVMLAAAQPMFVAWGERDRVLLYNDSYAEMLADKHPDALGRSFAEVWSEAWLNLAPLFADVFAGAPIQMDDIELYLQRNGRLEEAHFAFSYTPVRDPLGTVKGLFCPCRETTKEVMAQRTHEVERIRTERLFTHAPGFIAVYSGPDHVYEFANATHQQMFGNRDVIGKGVRELFPDTASQGFHELLDQVFATGERFVGRDFPIRLMDDPGQPQQYIDFIYQPILDDTGIVTGIFCEGFDVTDRHRAHEALEQSEARFRAAIDAVHGVLWTNSPDGEMIGEQPAWAALTGQAQSDYQGYGWAKAIHPDDAQPTIDAWNRAVAERRPFEFEHRVTRADGECRTYAVRAVPTFDADGAINEWIGVHTDITDERAVQAELRTSETRFRGLAEAMPGFAWTADGDGLLTYTSPHWHEYSGSDPDASLGAGWAAFVHPDDQPKAFAQWAHSIATGEPYEVEFRLRDRSGAYHWWLGRAQRSEDDDGARWIGTATELDAIVAARETLAMSREQLEAEVLARTAELRETEEQLRQSQKLEAIGQLTGGVAHDFNNLLTVIRGSVDLLRRPDLAEDHRTRYIDAISDTVTRAAKLTGQLLAFARRQALQPEVFDVGRALEATREIVQTLTGPRISVVVDLPDKPLHVHADPTQFDTAIVNMAANARDAMAGEGTLTITVAGADGVPPVRSHPALAGQFVVVSVADTGTGIPLDRIDQIFEPFFTTKAVGQGTGLGLSQVYGFAKQSGGEVRVTSEPGAGAIFMLYLPRSAQVAARPPEDIAPPPLAGHGTRVLVVEDNDAVGNFARATLEELGYHTHHAADADAALRKLAAAPGAYDVVFSDVVMPGMNGIELAREIGNRYPDLPVILTSGYSSVLAQEGTDGLDLLRKPYSMEELSRVLANVKVRRPTGGPARL